VSLALTGGLWAVALAWLPFSRLQIANTEVFFSLAIPLCIAWTGFEIIGWRMPRFARVAVFVRHIALLFFLLVATVVFSYLAAAAAFPLTDDALAAFDRALGLDFPAMMNWLAERPLLSRAVALSYYSTGIVLIVAVWVRPEETLRTISLATVVTCIVGLFFPAVGATAYYKAAGFYPLSGLWHHEAFMMLRTDPVLDFAKISGVIQFPSYHTVLAVVTAYALRQTVFFWPVAALNLVVIFATLPEGGHHFADTLAGAAIALGSILALRSRHAD
jgi:membrane-associated phospholipid phosphatase